MEKNGLVKKAGSIFESNISKITLTYVIFLSILIAFVTISGDDIAFHLQRIDAIMHNIKQQGISAFPMHIYSKTLEGYGYGSPMFYCDLFFLPFVLIGLIFHLEALGVYKLLLIAVLWATYFSIRKVSKWFFEGEYQQNLCTFFYMISTVTYGNEVGSAVGRNLAEIFVPIAIGGLYIIIYGNASNKTTEKLQQSRNKLSCAINNDEHTNWLWLAIGMSGLIFSNLLDALIVAGALFIMLLFSIKEIKKTHIKAIALATVTCILLVAWFVCPMLEQMTTNEFVVTSSQIKHDLGEFTVPLIGVVLPRQLATTLYYILGLSMESLPIAYMSGWLLMLLVSIYVIVNFKWLIKEKGIYGGLAVLLLLFTIYQTKLFPFALINKYIGFFQFPYRVGIVMTLCVAIMVPTLMNRESKEKSKTDITKILALVSVCLVVLSFMGTYGFRGAYHFYSGAPFSKFSYESMNIGAADYLPIELKTVNDGDYNTYIKNRGNKILQESDSKIKIYQEGDSICTIKNNEEGAIVEFPKVYYKGYIATDENGNNLSVYKSKNGLVEVNTPANTNKIRVEYKSTAVQKGSLIISLISAFYLLGYVIFRIKKRKREGNK